MTRVAAVDCGTNSIRLLVADINSTAPASLTDLDRRMEIVRLGQGVDRTGRIAPEAMKRTLEATGRYAAVCRDLGAARVRFVATSASRDASNAAEFVAGVRDVMGVEPEVVTGAEEAALSFAGATRELQGEHEPPFLVVDLGGGSTELVLGSDGVRAARSVDVGCVRMTERHLVSDPPTPEQVIAATADIDAALDVAASDVPIAETATLVGLAGSVTTITAHALRLPTYDAGRIHRAVLGVDVVRAACTELLEMSHDQRAALRFMHPGRVDVIGAGALVWRRVVERVARDAGITEVVTSEHDILDGIAWSVA
ncbi:MAG TPA: Ppx/GppA phosphatase family protein [Actinomycetales bacterium]|nr:Ppx/GppA phosphatase family protein [Actinomycetales bacterium]